MYAFYETTRSKKISQSSNMYLQFKWDTENYANHRYNVKNAKPCIDDSAPLTFTHMFIRPKKMQLELERYSTIQRNNRFLLERLATVQREGAWIDNKNFYKVKSLNTWRRQQEMIHLAYNNQIMIGRLQDVNAQLNRTKLEDEYLINQKYKANIRKFPSNWEKVHEHMNRTKADIFKKVFDLKYQTKAYRESRKLALQRWATEKEKHAVAKAEKAAKKAIEAEKQEQLDKKKRKAAAEERKRAMKERMQSSERWRSAREERLKKVEEKKRKEKEQERSERQRIQEKEKKERQQKKEEFEKWKRKQEENKMKEEKKREDELKRRAINERVKKKEKLQKLKAEQEEKKTGGDKDRETKKQETSKIAKSHLDREESGKVPTPERDSVSKVTSVKEDIIKTTEPSLVSSDEGDNEYEDISEVETTSDTDTTQESFISIPDQANEETSLISSDNDKEYEDIPEGETTPEFAAKEGTFHTPDRASVESSLVSSDAENTEYEDISEGETTPESVENQEIFADHDSDMSGEITTDHNTSTKETDKSEDKDDSA